MARRRSAETRVNPDGTLDISSWARPQHDGPPLRALAVLRWVRDVAFDSTLSDAGQPGSCGPTSRLRRALARAVLRHLGRGKWTCTTTRCVFPRRLWGRARAGWRPAATARVIGRKRVYTGPMRRSSWQRLDGYWLRGAGYYRSRVLAARRVVQQGARYCSDSRGDSRAGDGAGAHTVRGSPHAGHAGAAGRRCSMRRIRSTRIVPPGAAPAMGRYTGDVYYSGGAYYFSTLGAAEFCFRAAVGDSGTRRRAWHA